MAPSFIGFGPGALAFLDGIAANNDRDWFRDHAAEYEREVRADALFARQAEKTPDALAVVCGDASLSYRALSERAWRIARTRS